MQKPGQRRFQGKITSAVLAYQLSAFFNDRQPHAFIECEKGTSPAQIGSKHDTPVAVHIADTSNAVLVTMCRERNWMDKTAENSKLI
jgi:hypothetical protein